MSDLKEEDYLKNIFSFFENIDKENSIIPEYSTNLNEVELNIPSKDLYKDLYNNLLYYYQSNGKKYIETNEQKYFYKALLDLFKIIYESNPYFFFNNDTIQLFFAYLINFFKEFTIVNIDIIFKIFFGLLDEFATIKNDKIKKKVSEFENKAFNAIKSCLTPFIADLDIETGNIDKIDNFEEIINRLIILKSKKVSIPFYLKGFMEYFNQSIQKKLLIIKIYEYMEEINPFKNDNDKSSDYYLYQGYSLYEILNYKVLNEIDISFFNDMKKGRMMNNNAKAILKLSIKLLKTQSNEEFQKILSAEKLNKEVESPKISNSFDNTEKYYKELYDQLNYYLMEYKNYPKIKICKIIYKDFNRVLWLNFIKELLINLSQNDIEKNYIKVIFYFIVNLFYPDIDTENSLEFRDDTIPTLYSQCSFPEFLLSNQEIFHILDKDYSQYYTISEKKIQFDQIFNDIINKKISNEGKVINFRKNKLKNEIEVSRILKYSNYLPFLLLKHYLDDHKVFSIKNSNLNLFDFYRNCFCYLGDSNERNFIEKVRCINIIESNEDEKKNLIIEILSNKDFIKSLKEIMTSTVMNNAYYIINKFYLLNGKMNQEEEIEIIKEKKKMNLDDIEKETLKESENKNQKDQNINFINNKPIIYYYNKFCKELEKYNYTNTFIIMGLPNNIKGFTFRFLKIVLNTKGINLNFDDIVSTNTLLKAYLIFVIIHEQNHFIKRYFNIDVQTDLCETPKISGYSEGGKHLIKLLFGEEMINKNINLKQAEYILNTENWKEKSIYEFRKDFLNIKSGGDKNTISYLNSENSSICDHSKLHA